MTRVKGRVCAVTCRQGPMSDKLLLWTQPDRGVRPYLKLVGPIPESMSLQAACHQNRHVCSAGWLGQTTPYLPQRVAG